MQSFQIHGSHNDSTILIGHSLQELQATFSKDHLILISDENVIRLHGHLFPKAKLISIVPGEASKTLDSAARIYREMLAHKADRQTVLLGIGGGIVCDLTGFVASTFMRGIRVAFAPTTLLAQVDASIGGKNGVNLDGLKNMVGTFTQPEKVICDLDILSTLPSRELGCGLAEIVKHAAIADLQLFDFLESHVESLLNLEQKTLERVVLDSIRIKTDEVNRDEKEQGTRRILNFGHTFGHALEKMTKLPHGQAVSLGMVLASAMSVQRGLLTGEEKLRLTRLLDSFQLPTRLADCGISSQNLLETMLKDKKREGDRIHLVLVNGLGKAVVRPTSLEELREALCSLHV